MNNPLPPGWSMPNDAYIEGAYKNDGIVWIDRNPATMKDKEALDDVMGSDTKVDTLSIVGLYDKGWSTFFDENTLDTIPQGGEGSVAYELKLVGEVGGGVKFTKEKIWAYNTEGVYVKDVPADCGSYHTVYSGMYSDNHWGPAPGSQADLMHSGGSYYWDDIRKLYDIRF